VSHLRLPVLPPHAEHAPRSPSREVRRTSSGGGSLGKDGRRKRPYPADVSGKWSRRRKVVYGALIAIWVALPWISIGGHPAVFLDIDRRQFFLFGHTFNSQDIWLVFFGVTGLGFGLVYATALLGRVFCGWACPQTVFIEALFRPIERMVNGPRNIAQRRAAGPLTFDRLVRTAVTHALYVVAALFVAHVFLAYFVSLPKVFEIVRAAPAEHPEAFAWMLGTTALFYVNFGIFREQFCVVMCPYGRLQSVLIDDDSLVVGYDERRGEPRTKATARARAPSLTTPESAEAAGAGTAGAGTAGVGTGGADCVDCNRCVVVCPTGIDIRDGLQLDCIACTACIDACDDVMDKLGRERGLVRYDSLRGLRGEGRKVLRPRLYVYTAMLGVGIVVGTMALRTREPFEANVLRLPGAPYVRDEGAIRNAFELHLVNKEAKSATFTVEPAAAPGLSFVVPMRELTVEPLGSRRVPVFVTMAAADFTADQPFSIRIRMSAEGGKSGEREARAVFLGATP
jgi:cytochrome c oxidase accessory protein FixG